MEDGIDDSITSAAHRAVEIFRDPKMQYTDADHFALELAGSRLAAARKEQGLTQTELGKRLNLPQSMISRIERNPDRTTVKTLRRIAKALNIDLSALI